MHDSARTEMFRFITGSGFTFDVLFCRHLIDLLTRAMLFVRVVEFIIDVWGNLAFQR